MIRSIIDNDLYKFTMQQAAHRLYPDALAEYQLTNRGLTPFPEGLAQKVKREILKMADMGLTSGQKQWLETTCPYFTPDYLDFLSSYRYDPEEVTVIQEGVSLTVSVKGRWCKTILWEVPLMAIISETYFAMTRPDILSREKIREQNQTKAGLMADNDIKFVDFGTRRRFSAANHEHLVQDILELDNHSLIGTSNVHLAKQFNIAPIGTLAHEWIMFHSALGSYRASNTLAMDAWLKVYPDVLGIALTDTYTTGLFLKDFHDRAGQFDGVRQDSGDPLTFLQTMIDHYKTLGIDPTSKTIVFSDGLDPDRALAIHRICEGKIKDAYGIGTNLTNDVGSTPLNIVIKLSGCRTGPDANFQSTVKLSDDRGKHTGDNAELVRCLDELGIP